MADFSYFLASGTITKSTLLASSSNNIENFPIQSDMPPLPGWTCPNRRLTKRPKPAFIYQTANLAQNADGFYEFQWGWDYWTTAQMAYILNTFFGAADIYSTLSTSVTLQTYFDSTYVAFTSLMLRPIWGDHYSSEDFGYVDVALRFVGGAIITV